MTKVTGACPGGGGHPLEIEKQKKHKKNQVIRENFKLFHLDFATFLVGSIIFSSAIFWAGPPLKNWKAKNKKKPIRFSPPPLTNSWTRDWVTIVVC